MNEPRPPKYAWGQPVIAAVDLYNDGSHPEAGEDQLLVVAGGPGEIVQVGHHAEANLPVYMVDFGIAVIGCLEEEIARAGTELDPPAPGADEARAS
jgi:nitrogen fixation protein NifZ